MSPSTASLAPTYTPKTLEQKTSAKTALQQELGWPQEPKRPIVCLPAGMTDELGGTLLTQVLPGILSLPVEILILGKGGSEYGALFTKLAKEHGHRVAIIPNKPANIEKMFAAADIALFFADPAKQPEIGTCLLFGTVPVAPATDVLENYDPVQERGTGFTYEDATMWGCYGALVRALETFKFPYDWRTIQKQCMNAGQ